jgi:hypothetical protein
MTESSGGDLGVQMIRNMVVVGAIAMSSIGAIGHTAMPATALDNTPWQLPATPPRCTDAEATSGDVGDCLLAFYGDPSETGWGVPPSPGVGSGWSWNGYTYRGSAALADWEGSTIGSNAEPIAGLDANDLEIHVDAQALFEGFLRDIDHGGYNVRGASGYSFRCTSGNGGWSCPSGDIDDLSNHAYGLAIDMNAGTNPIRRYYSVGGQTACATPIATDLPRWVIETAERWGLYWGGYGWNSGCASTSTERSSVYRDPPHFEFRGTPEHARAIAAFNLLNDPTAFCTTVVDNEGHEVERCNHTGLPSAGWRIPIDIDAPDGAVAAMVNVTAVNGVGPGFLAVESCEPSEAGPSTSSVTFPRGDAVAAMAIIEFDERFCLYHSTSVHSIIDVVAFMGPEGEPLWLETATPKRLTDSRVEGFCERTTDGEDQGRSCREGRVEGTHVIPRANDNPFIANIAVIEGAAPGFLQAGRCDAVGGDAVFSNLNYMSANVRSNLAIVEGGQTGSCAYVLSDTHVIVDELAELNAESGLGWRLPGVRRALDTRECSPTWCEGQPDVRTTIELDLETDATSVAISIIAAQTEAPGFVSVGRCSEFTDGHGPGTSNLNHMTGETVTNLAIADLEDGVLCIFTLASAHLIVDVQAELIEEQSIGVLPTTPTRAHDSRLL